MTKPSHARLGNQCGVVCCYFGKWPPAFQLCLDSCGWNPDFDFILMTDIPLAGYRVPANVKVMPMAFADLRDRLVSFAVREAGANEIRARKALEHPYKICDYRPLFGEIFAAELSGLAYFGHCDVDLIWGRLGRFLPIEGDRYRKILPCGHLTLYRNEAEVCRAWRRAEDCGVRPFREVAETSEACFFDEDKGANRIFGKLWPEVFFARQPSEVPFDDLKWWLPDMVPIQRDDGIRRYYEFSAECGCQACTMRGLRVIRQEVAYVHFQKRTIDNRVPPDDASCRWRFAGNRFVAGGPANALLALIYVRNRFVRRLWGTVKWKIVHRRWRP